MDRIQKIALARVLFELIEADFTLEQAEMSFFESAISNEYLAISESMLVQAKCMKLDKAIAILKELDARKRADIIGLLKRLALSDGTCVPLEAIQIFAIEQALEHDAYIYTAPANDMGINNMQTIFIENHPTSISEIVKQNAREICKELALAGLDFVYIPDVVNDYKCMDIDYLRKVVHYMIPSFGPDKIDSVCSDLQSLTTARFCRDLLYKKINLPLLDVAPSLLIKISESELIEQYDADDVERTNYANFLRIELKEDVITQIHEIVDSVQPMINCAIPITHKPQIKKFKYYGFHRSLFDLIAFGKEQKEYKLIFDLTQDHSQVYFEPTDGSIERIPLKLNPQEMTLFIMIVKTSWEGNGLDWRDNPPKAIRDQILADYNSIYARIGHGKHVHVYKDRTQTHHIKNKIQSIACIANMELFIPIHIKDGIHSYYRVKGTQRNIQIKE